MDKPVAKIGEIPEGGAIVVPYEEGREVAIFKVKGKFYAIDNECPHAGAPLCEGVLEGCRLTCPWHAWQFDLSTGECLTAPGASVEFFPLRIEGEEIYLD